jgi:hypothetical protein
MVARSHARTKPVAAEAIKLKELDRESHSHHAKLLVDQGFDLAENGVIRKADEESL